MSYDSPSPRSPFFQLNKIVFLFLTYHKYLCSPQQNELRFRYVTIDAIDILSTFNKQVGMRAKGGLWIYFSACCSHIFCLSVHNLAWGKCSIMLSLPLVFWLPIDDYQLLFFKPIIIYLLKFTMSRIRGRTWKELENKTK